MWADNETNDASIIPPAPQNKGPAASVVESGERRLWQCLQPPKSCSRRRLMENAFSTHQGSCGSPRGKGEG